MPGSKTIVVIDSEPTVRATVKTILESAGYLVFATDEFGRALNELRKNPADLVVTNVFLKGITGYDAMLALKENFPDMRVLMVSGLPDAEAISVWTGRKGFDVFPKPFTANDLIRKVEEMLACATASGHGQ